MKLNTFIKKYDGKILEDDGCVNSREFIQFAKDFRSMLREICKEIGANLVKCQTGHYHIFGFVEADGKYVYFSYDEPRHARIDMAKGNCDGILIRTAKDTKDYSGGRNCFCSFYNIKESLAKLITQE